MRLVKMMGPLGGRCGEGGEMLWCTEGGLIVTFFDTTKYILMLYM